MQLSPNIPHEWWKDILRFVVELGALGFMVAAFKAWKERKKPAAEVRELDAKTELTLVKTNIAASEMLRQTMQDLLEQQEGMLELVDKLNTVTRERDQALTEKRLVWNQLESARKVLERHNLKAELDKLTKTSGG